MAFEFPPINEAGSYRSLRFVNSLAANDICPIVITFAIDDNLLKTKKNIDYGLMELIHPEVQIIRLSLDDINKLVKTKLHKFIYKFNNIIGDNFLDIINKQNIKLIEDLISKEKPAAIITSCPPFSSSVLCSKLSKKYKIPLILDFRDAWSEWCMVPYPSRLHYLMRKGLEKKILKSASAIISVTPELIDKYQKAHPGITKNKFKLIFNSTSFILKEGELILLKPLEMDRHINIGYTGSFYYEPLIQNEKMIWNKIKHIHRLLRYYPVKEDWLYRSPHFFLKTLSNLFYKNSNLRSNIYFHHIGETPGWLKSMIAENNLDRNVIVHGYQNLENVLKLEKEFDLLLATSEKVIGNEHYCLPSKLFTYLKAKKPILAFVTDGIQKKFLENTNLGIFCNPDDIENSTLIIENCIKSGVEKKINAEYLNKFSDQNCNKEFVDIISNILNGN